MTELRAIYTLWLREVKRYLRDRVRIITGFFQPILWLVIFGTGFHFSGTIGDLTYQEYIFPGIIGQTLLFTSIFMGISVIWDREYGFLKEVLVAPISRLSVFLGKMLGDCTDALIQGTIVFVVGALLVMRLDLIIFLEALPIMVLTTVGLVSIGLTIACFIDSLESFGVIFSFVNLPLFFLSGALFPIQGDIPSWLQISSQFNPLTYCVDALRTVILGDAWSPLHGLYYNLAVISCFDVIMIVIGTFAFSRRK